MIFDKLCNAPLYYGLHERLRHAFLWLQEADFGTIPDGKHFIEDKDIFAVVSTDRTKPTAEAQLEVHREYMDLQYIIRGQENFALIPTEYVGRALSQIPERDLYFYEYDDRADLLLVREGYFMVLHPQDAHATRIAAGDAAQTRKVILKVRI